MTQVLLNLAGNAVKFTETGAVDILADAVDGHFEIAVRDTGPGIAAKDQALIFDEFQQVDNSSTRQKGGTGLGLAISKRIVEMHGGTIDVESVLGSGLDVPHEDTDPGGRGREGRMSKRILMIEDTEDNRQIVRDLIATTEYELIEAADGAAGVAAAAAREAGPDPHGYPASGDRRV